MFRSKAGVDRHVQEQFRKVTDEKERNLRCYNIAKLYYAVQEYELARRYVSSYLEVKGDSAPAYKLLGEILEVLGQKEASLTQYKHSLELESRQDDLVLKVCELLTDPDIGMDPNSVRYWTERASERFPSHPIIFKVKERMLMTENSELNSDDLEALIASELLVRPSDIQLRVKLIKYYICKDRLEDAYQHAIDVEATFFHRDSLVWYETLCELLTKLEKSKPQKWSFWIIYLSSLERYAALSLKEQGMQIPKTVQDAAQAVFTFDQALTESKKYNIDSNQIFSDQMYEHMFGQLNYHLACLILRRTKREQGNWSETVRLSAPLLLSCIHCAPIDITAPWALRLKDQEKAQVLVWHREASYRCSQSEHVLRDYAKDDTKRLLDKIDKFCIVSWRERVYQRVFTTQKHISSMSKSFFANNKSPTPTLRLLSYTELKLYDKVSEEVYPSSLHHHVWLGIVRNPRLSKYPELKNQYCHVFPDLQLSAHNLSHAAPESLGKLDVDAFLNAAVLCSSAIVEDQQRSGFLNPERFPTLPADLTNTLCTAIQEKWWLSAYKIYRNQDGIGGDLGELRQELQLGLEVVRCIGNHSLHPKIIVHLAKMFQQRAKNLREKDKSHPDIKFLEARYELYWSTAIPLLERLLNNQTIRSVNTKIFDYQGQEMANLELSNALEEARLILAEKFVKEKQHELAIEALQNLKCPEASYLQSQIYKDLADELIGSLPKESLTSAMRSQHIILLSKARGCYYLTLDRLRSPGVDPNHPLNAELGTEIALIENDLRRIDPDLHKNELNKNDCDGLSDESYSSAQSESNQIMNQEYSMMSLATHRHLVNRTPKQTSTPRRIHHDTYIDHSKSKVQFEARPSPERLDAQIRQLMYSKDTMIQTIVEQYKAIVESNKTLVESNKLMKEMLDDLRREFTEFKRNSDKKSSGKSISTKENITDETGSYVIEEDLYENDLNYTQSIQSSGPAGLPPGGAQIPQNLFGNQRNPYSPLVYSSTGPALPGYYPPPFPGAFSDSHSQHLQPLYQPNVYGMPMYPRAPDQTLTGLQSGIQPGMLRQNLFTGRMMNQMPMNDLIPQQHPGTAGLPFQMQQQQHLDSSRSGVPDPTNGPISSLGQLLINKDAPAVKVPPVNVVITTSDTLPTSAPAVQPTLSVTIPVQHRNIGISGAPQALSTPAANISIDSIPHNYQISMPSQAMIPTTVILPSLATTMTNSVAAASLHESMQKSARNNKSIFSAGSHNSSIEAVEIEHDPIPDFQPVIPLPDEVKVTTGEEDEETLFCARAKLYRFVEKEWKDRGVGDVKLLKNKEGQVRLLMRRDQVLKIAANHRLTIDMELTPMPNTDRAWFWIANDYADEVFQIEKFSIKFKLFEEAQSFKEAFEKAKMSLSVSPVKSLGIQGILEPMNQNSSIPKSTAVSLTTPVVVGGLSFTNPPIIQKPTTSDNSKTVKPAEELAKPSPFAGFSFSSFSANQSTGFPLSKTAEAKSSSSEVEVTKIAREDPPDRTETSGKSARPSFSAIFKPAAGSWECRSCYILNEPSSIKCLACAAPAPSRSEKCHEPLAEMLKPAEGSWECSSCYTRNDAGSQQCICCEDLLPSSKMFKHQAGSWECGSCNTRNELSTSKCISCSARSPSLNAESTKIEEVDKPLAEMFKPTAGSWECGLCYIKNDGGSRKCLACEAPAPLSQMFKSQTDSWECQKCLIKNSKSNIYCAACDSPSNSLLPAKQKSFDGFGLKTSSVTAQSFTFGIAPGAASATQLGFDNIFKEKNSSGPAADSTPTFTFGISQTKDVKESGVFSFKAAGVEEKKPEEYMGFGNFQGSAPTTDFVFGGTQKSENLGKKSSFAFGSPGKSFDFQFAPKSPVKSPGSAGDAGEDEVAESEDIYFAPVVPLPDKIEVKTGEEDEEILYTHRAKLFRFDTNTKEWKERGLGDIKLLKHKLNKKLRLVMRRDQTLKLCLNQYVPMDLEISSKDEKTWLWKAADFSEGEIEHVSLACRFKNSEIAVKFKKSVEDAIEVVDKNVQTKALETSEKVSTSPSEEFIEDIQVVYELKVTEDEKYAALKLKLPENFYAYKQKKDCPGCLGCQEPDAPLFDKKNKNSETIPEIVTKPSGIIMGSQLAAPKLTIARSSPTSLPIATANFSFGEESQKNSMSKQNQSIFGDPAEKKEGVFIDNKTSFVFGATKNDSNEIKNMFSGGVNVCGLSTAMQPQTTLNFGKPNFGESPPVSSEQGIFGNSSTVNIFGGSTTAKTDSSSTVTSFRGATTFPSGFGSVGTFSSPPNFPPLTNAGNIFGGNIVSNPPTFRKNSGESTLSTSNEANSPFGTNSSFGSISNSTVVSGGSRVFGGNLFGGKSKLDDEKNETTNSLFFKQSSDTLAFGSLAAKAATSPGFKTDPNFSFAGAGASVFGAKTLNSSNTSFLAEKTPQKNEEENEAEEGSENDRQDNEYDPHYEPIIPLPDAIEVRTGEEDEEKVFCQRAKFYRYESETKEWKERGTGEMKLLRHAARGSYRLLLRREQVHKVVCNMALSSDFDLQRLNTSDRAWVWAGNNFAEENPAIEKLAVRFKNPEVAIKFKDAVDLAKQDLGLRQNSNLKSLDYSNPDDEDEEEPAVMYKGSATLSFFDQTWETVGSGQLTMLYDSEIFGAKIVFETDCGEVACCTVITEETEIDIDKNDCIWTAINDVYDPPIKKTYKAKFIEESDARDFYLSFQEGQDCAKQAGITEYYEDQ